ncbi:MAG: hypothetical protein ABSF21_00165 [Dehalococcoidia bacterium]|jgi:hypothetical protein
MEFLENKILYIFGEDGYFIEDTKTHEIWKLRPATPEERDELLQRMMKNSNKALPN